MKALWSYTGAAAFSPKVLAMRRGALKTTESLTASPLQEGALMGTAGASGASWSERTSLGEPPLAPPPSPESKSGWAHQVERLRWGGLGVHGRAFLRAPARQAPGHVRTCCHHCGVVRFWSRPREGSAGYQCWRYHRAGTGNRDQLRRIRLHQSPS